MLSTVSKETALLVFLKLKASPQNKVNVYLASFKDCKIALMRILEFLPKKKKKFEVNLKHVRGEHVILACATQENKL